MIRARRGITINIEMIARELDRISEELVMEDVFVNERMSSLFLKFEKEVLKKLDRVSSSAPIAVQLVQGIEEVRSEIEMKMGLTGRAAVKAIWEAMKGKFDSLMQPFPYLYKKYGRYEVDQIVGRYY